jgi:pimeloyl-ACP methyl ester carboxylesterase
MNYARVTGTLLLCVWVGVAAAAAPARPPLQQSLDLDTFDHMKKVKQLPNGERLAYIDMGNPDGPAVILIHGYTDSARDWLPLVPFLSPNYRLILVDIRGHGQSSKPECCYTLIDFAYDIKQLMDALDVSQADLIGHSLGSLISQVFAEQWPARTRRVVLISSTAGPNPCGPAKKPAFDFATEIRKLKEPIDPESPFMIEWWASPTPVDPEFLKRQRRDAAAIPLAVWLAVLDQGLNYAGLQQRLPKLKAKALLIWGSKDPIFDEDARETLRAGLPSAKVKTFVGLGHNPFWENPRAVADAINAFLDAT